MALSFGMNGSMALYHVELRCPILGRCGLGNFEVDGLEINLGNFALGENSKY